MAAANPFDISTSKPSDPNATPAAAPAPAPGLVANAMTSAANAAPAATATPGQATAAQANVAPGTGSLVNIDPAKQTVQGQIADITAKDSPLQQQAVTRAAQAMAQRGLVNSSIGVTAAESAVLGAALPIAQQDASTYQNTALANADIKNQFESSNVAARTTNAQFNANALTDTSKTNAGLISDAGKFNADSANTTARFNAEQTNTVNRQNSQQAAQLQLQQLDATTRAGVANIEANYKTLMQSSQSASDLYRQTIDAMSSISRDPNLDAAGKQAALTQQTQLLQNGMNLLASFNNLNVAGLLNFTDLATTPGGTVGTAGVAPPAPAAGAGGGLVWDGNRFVGQGRSD